MLLNLGVGHPGCRPGGVTHWPRDFQPVSQGLLSLRILVCKIRTGEAFRDAVGTRADSGVQAPSMMLDTAGGQ